MRVSISICLICRACSPTPAKREIIRIREELSHVLGYVAAVSPEDVDGDDDDPLLQVPGFRIGKRGMEKNSIPLSAVMAAPAESRSTPMAASSANCRAKRERLAKTSISPSTARFSVSPTS